MNFKQNQNNYILNQKNLYKKGYLYVTDRDQEIHNKEYLVILDSFEQKLLMYQSDNRGNEN